MSNMILKHGALKYSKTLFELGSMIQRLGDRSSPSVLECLATKATTGLDLEMLLAGSKREVEKFQVSFISELDAYLRL